MAKKNKKIVPFTKTAPAESLDKIPETASLDDYEKVVAKMANASDDIIDAALDRMEGKVEQPKKETPPPVVPDEEDITEDPDTLLKEGKKDEAAQALIDNLAKDLQEAKTALYEANNDKNAFAEQVKELVDKNDNLILKNSELEFEISRLNAENNRIRQENEQLRAKLSMPSLPSGPSCVERQNRTRKVPATPLVKRPKMSMNGYEFWN